MTDRTGQVWEAYWAHDTIVYLVLGLDEEDHTMLKLFNMNDGIVEHIVGKVFDDVEHPRVDQYMRISLWKRLA